MKKIVKGLVWLSLIVVASAAIISFLLRMSEDDIW